MSSAQSTELVTGPGVNYNLFIGFVWAGFALGTVFVAFRLTARFRGPRRLFWDDGFLVFAYLLNIITTALWQWAAKDMYYTLNVSAGLAAIEADFVTRTRRWLVVNLIVEIFFYTTLLGVKLSFLFFFRRLGHNVHGQRYLWWPILIFSLIVFFASIGDVQYECLVGPTSKILTYCATPTASRFTTLTLIINCALDVLSDFLIILIPITLLWNVRIPWKRKIAFMGLFSLSIITIGVAITRTADIAATAKSNGSPDPTYLWLWSTIQATLAVIVACLSAFPQLFSQSAQKPVWTPTDTYYQRLKARMSRKNNSSDPLFDLSVMSKPGEATHSIVNYEGSKDQDADIHIASYDRERPFLVPGRHEPTTTCSGGPSDPGAVLMGNQITREREYRVI